MKKIRLSDGCLLVLALLGIAFIHSCMYELDIDTPADPRASLTCTSWETITQLNVDSNPTGSSLTYCKEYSYE